MKIKHYIAVIFLVFSCSSINAQDSRRLKIIYNLKTGNLKYDSGDKIKDEFNIVGDAGNVEINLEDINPFLYNIKISELQNIRMDARQLENNNISFFNSISYEIKDLSYSNVQIGVAPKNYSAKELSDQKAAVEKKYQEMMKSFGEEQQLLAKEPKIDPDKKEESEKAKADWQAKLNTSRLKTQQLLREKNEMLDNFEKSVLKSEDVMDRIKMYNDKIDTLKKRLHKVNDIALFYRALQNMMYTDWDTNFTIIKLKTDLTTNVFPNFKTNDNLTVFLNRIVTDASKSYGELSDYYNHISNGFPAESPIIPELVKSISNIKSTMDQVKQEEILKFIDHIDRTYNLINTKSLKNIYFANIINDDADFIRFTIEGTPVTGLPPSVSARSFKIDVEIPIRGGVKIDLSTGLLNTFGLFNKSYRYEGVAGSAGRYRVVENREKSLLSPNLGLMLHIYRRNSIRNFRPAGSIGIGLAEDQNVRYYGGFSAIFGRKQRFVISTGIVAGQVTYADRTVLDRELTLTTEDLLKPIPNRTPSPYRLGGFLGFTFNLSGSNSDFTGRMNGRGK